MNLEELNGTLQELQDQKKNLIGQQRKFEKRPIRRDLYNKKYIRKRKSDQKIYFQEPQKKIHRNNDQNENPSEKYQKMRLQSTIIVNKPQNNEEPQVQEKNYGTNKVRDRKMFGSILSHLKKAQIVLEKEQTTIKKQELATQKASGKNQQELQRLKQQILDKKNENLKKLQEEKIQNQKKLITVNHQIMYNKIYKHILQLSNFIRTKQDPPLFWIPNKQNEKTEKLLQETQQLLKGQKEDLEKKAEIQLQQLLEKFQQEKENEKEKEVQKIETVEKSESEQNDHEVPDQEIEDIIN